MSVLVEIFSVHTFKRRFSYRSLAWMSCINRLRLVVTGASSSHADSYQRRLVPSQSCFFLSFKGFIASKQVCGLLQCWNCQAYVLGLVMTCWDTRKWDGVALALPASSLRLEPGPGLTALGLIITCLHEGWDCALTLPFHIPGFRSCWAVDSLMASAFFFFFTKHLSMSQPCWHNVIRPGSSADCRSRERSLRGTRQALRETKTGVEFI